MGADLKIVRWELRRTIEDLQALDRQLHTCIYDRLDVVVVVVVVVVVSFLQNSSLYH